MSNLFISHSSRDNAAAKELQSRLEEQGHRSIFLDLDPEVGIQAGVSWERTLYTKLRACRAVVALCSDSYLNSQWCFAEIALARMEGKELFVLQVENSPFLTIGTMRSDFLGLLQSSVPLQGLGRKSLSVGPMAREVNGGLLKKSLRINRS